MFFMYFLIPMQMKPSHANTLQPVYHLSLRQGCANILLKKNGKDKHEDIVMYTLNYFFLFGPQRSFVFVYLDDFTVLHFTVLKLTVLYCTALHGLCILDSLIECSVHCTSLHCT